MDASKYPRPDSTPAGPYGKDKTWGIVIIVLSALGICGGLVIGGIGGAVGAAGAASVANAGGRAGDAAAVGATGGLVAMMGFVMVALCVAQLVGGIGILNSRRWGFLVTGGFAALSVLGNLLRLPAGILGLIISGVILYYCWSRLSGKEGPTPV